MLFTVIGVLCRDLPLSTTSFSVELMSASKRAYIKDSSIGIVCTSVVYAMF